MESSLPLKILVYCNLYKDYSGLFISHAIDEVAFSQLNEKHLEEMGITNNRHRELIIKCRTQLFGTEELSSGTNPVQTYNSAQETTISLAMLVKASPAQTPAKQEAPDNFLKKLHMVDLADKGITRMAHLESCSRLQVLYLSNNKITLIQGLEALECLRILYLDNNNISQITGFTALYSLEKLFLDLNCVSTLEGLEHCECLSELHMNRQRTQSPLQVSEMTMVGLSRGLKRLFLSETNLEDISFFWFLDKLEELDLSNNSVSIGEATIKALRCLKSLTTLLLKDNPIAARPKYRDEMILCLPKLTALDSKSIHSNEKQFIYRLKGKKLGLIKQPTAHPVLNGPAVHLEILGSKLDN